MKDLSSLKEDFKPFWISLCDSELDAEVMAQIDAMSYQKIHSAAKHSQELGITFHIEGDSHWKMIEQDDKMFQKWFSRHPDYDLIKHLVVNSSKGYHVETLAHVLKTFKQSSEIDCKILSTIP